jgi:hypothetical protein
MPILSVSITNKMATFHKRGRGVVCGNKDYVIEFSFDSEWEGYEDKTARFIWGGKFYDVPFTGTTCAMPMVRRTDTVSVGVYAGDLCTTTPAVIPCQRSVLCGADAPHDENEAHYASEAQEAAQEAKEHAEAAQQAAKEATDVGVEMAEALNVVRTELGVEETAVSDLSCRVGQLESAAEGNLFDSVTVKEGAVPENALPYARLESVSGCTHIRSRNLLPFPYAGGETYNGDGSITNKQEVITSDNIKWIINASVAFTVPQGVYYLSGCPKGGGASTYSLQAIAYNNSKAVLTVDDFGEGAFFDLRGLTYTRLSLKTIIKAGVSANGLTFHPQLEKGYGATPFEPYTLKAAKPKAVQLVRDNPMVITEDFIPDEYISEKDKGFRYTRNGNVFSVYSPSTVAAYGYIYLKIDKSKLENKKYYLHVKLIKGSIERLQFFKNGTSFMRGLTLEDDGTGCTYLYGDDLLTADFIEVQYVGIGLNDDGSRKEAEIEFIGLYDTQDTPDDVVVSVDIPEELVAHELYGHGAPDSPNSVDLRARVLRRNSVLQEHADGQDYLMTDYTTDLVNSRAEEVDLFEALKDSSAYIKLPEDLAGCKVHIVPEDEYTPASCLQCSLVFQTKRDIAQAVLAVLATASAAAEDIITD